MYPILLIHEQAFQFYLVYYPNNDDWISMHTQSSDTPQLHEIPSPSHQLYPFSGKYCLCDRWAPPLRDSHSWFKCIRYLHSLIHLCLCILLSFDESGCLSQLHWWWRCGLLNQDTTTTWSLESQALPIPTHRCSYSIHQIYCICTHRRETSLVFCV